MAHASIYLGPFEWNFPALRPETSTYKTRDEVEKPIDEVDATGIRFGYMERSKRVFTLVRIDDVVLRNPVLVTERHQEGKDFGPRPTQFEDDAAARYLLDAIVENPELRDMLGAKLRRLSPT